MEQREHWPPVAPAAPPAPAYTGGGSGDDIVLILLHADTNRSSFVHASSCNSCTCEWRRLFVFAAFVVLVVVVDVEATRATTPRRIPANKSTTSALQRPAICQRQQHQQQQQLRSIWLLCAVDQSLSTRPGRRQTNGHDEQRLVKWPSRGGDTSTRIHHHHHHHRQQQRQQ